MLSLDFKCSFTYFHVEYFGNEILHFYRQTAFKKNKFMFDLPLKDINWDYLKLLEHNYIKFSTKKPILVGKVFPTKYQRFMIRRPIPIENRDSWYDLYRVFEERKVIMQYKCTCLDCGATWKYGYDEAEQVESDRHKQNFKSTFEMAFIPLMAIPDKYIRNLNKCPRCGSQNIKKENERISKVEF